MGSPTPSISVIVPTYGRPADLGKCLASLADLDYPCNAFEVIVVDDGSPSSLDEVVAPFRQRFQLQLQRQSRKGPGAARNMGLVVAKGDFVAFTADDCAPSPDWLRRLAACFVRSPGSAVGGRIVNAFPNNPFSTSTDLLISYMYDYYNRVPDQARFFTPNNLAFPIQPLRALGGFTPSLLTGEDRDLCERWRAAGHAMMYAPDVVVTHAHPLDLARFCRLHFQYGQGSSRFRRSSSMRSDSVGFEPLSFYLNLVRYPFGRSSVARAVLLSGLLGVAQVANATGFLYQSFTRFREDRPA